MRAVFLFVLLLQSAVYAQSVRGTVTDASHKPLSQASIQLTQSETNRRRTAVTDELGIFTISNLAPGEYRIEAEHAGFRKHVKPITVQLNQDMQIEIPLIAG